MASNTRDALLERPLPHNAEAERAILGAGILDNGLIDEAAYSLETDDFYIRANQFCFYAMVTLRHRGSEVSPILVAEFLRAEGHLEQVGGVSYLSDLTYGLPHFANVSAYARVVKGHSLMRQLVKAANKITGEALEAEDEPAVILQHAEQMIFALGAGGGRGSTVRRFDALGAAVREEFARWVEGRTNAVPTGIHELDQKLKLGGLARRDLIYVAARSSRGKTALTLQMFKHAAMSGTPGLLFSLEMSGESLYLRAHAGIADVPHWKLRPDIIRDDAAFRQHVLAAMPVTDRLEIYIDDTARTLSKIESISRHYVARYGVGLLGGDYTQLVDPELKGNSREQEVGKVSRGFKGIAHMLDVPFVATSQLNRKASDTERPELENLRECLDGDTLIFNAATGERVSVRRVVDEHLRFDVLAVNDEMKLRRAPLVDAWRVGARNVFEVVTRTGRKICCTGGHRFFTSSGFVELKELGVGDLIGVPRVYPSAGRTDSSLRRLELLGVLIGDGYLGGTAALTCAPSDVEYFAGIGRDEFKLRPCAKPERLTSKVVKLVFTTGQPRTARGNDLTTWLRGLGIWKCTGARKHVPDYVFGCDRARVAAFLRGLFHADGSISAAARALRVRLATISERLARDVQHLLLRLGILSRVGRESHLNSGIAGSQPFIFTVDISARGHVESFMRSVGFLGEKDANARRMLVAKVTHTERLDLLPLSATTYAGRLRKVRGLSHTAFGWRVQGKRMTRHTARMLGRLHKVEKLIRLGNSDVLWDEIASITPLGVRDVFDVTVGRLHNFCVDDFITHNSGQQEQDADVVLMPYNVNKNDIEQPVRSMKLYVPKQRNGRAGFEIEIDFDADKQTFLTEQMYADREVERINRGEYDEPPPVPAPAPPESYTFDDDLSRFHVPFGDEGDGR